jgi:hypothetical protein
MGMTPEQIAKIAVENRGFLPHEAEEVTSSLDHMTIEQLHQTDILIDEAMPEATLTDESSTTSLGQILVLLYTFMARRIIAMGEGHGKSVIRQLEKAFLENMKRHELLPPVIELLQEQHRKSREDHISKRVMWLSLITLAQGMYIHPDIPYDSESGLWMEKKK